MCAAPKESKAFKGFKFNSVGSQFKKQLAELMGQLQVREPPVDVCCVDVCVCMGVCICRGRRIALYCAIFQALYVPERPHATEILSSNFEG